MTAPEQTLSAPSTDEILAREAKGRLQVGLGALLAGVLAVVSGVAPSLIYNDFPHVFLVEALRDAAGQDIGRDGLKTAQIFFYDDKAIPLVLIAVAQAITAIGIGFLLVYLLDASTARGATTPRFTRIFVLFGAMATALGALVLQIGVMIRAHDFVASSDHSTAAAHDVLRSGIVVTASGIGGIGNLALAAGFVMVALGAMRVGLLTRFLGVLGAIVGVLIVLGPLSGSPTFIVQSCWLLMAGVLVLGRWPRGTPPAWTTGVAMPWPSQQEVREQRERARGGGGGGGRGGGGAPAPSPEPVVEPSSNGPNGSAAARRKRKRRT